MNRMAESVPRVGLLVTCLVDLMRPSVGFAAVKLLEQAGCVVEVPSQTCCGQPAFNSGDRATARKLAAQNIRAFRGYDYVVIPSGSCGGTVIKHYPEMFADDPNLAPQAQELAEKTHELVSFLTDVRGMTRVEARFDGTGCGNSASAISRANCSRACWGSTSSRWRTRTCAVASAAPSR